MIIDDNWMICFTNLLTPYFGMGFLQQGWKISISIRGHKNGLSKKKKKKVSFSNTQYEKCLNAKSSLKQQIQDAHFHRLLIKRIVQ